jgi:hypothetical protein
MDLVWYVDRLRQELSSAAEAADDKVREFAERFVTPFSHAIRLTLLEALSAAADEITRDLAPGSVEIRLRGLDPSFVVTLPPADEEYDEYDDEPEDEIPGAGAAPSLAAVPVAAVNGNGNGNGDGGATSRINFRPPEYLKARIEEAASREQLSVNAWLVRAVSTVLESNDRGANPVRRAPRRTRRRPERFTGWVT